MFTFPLSKMVGGIRFEHTHRLIASDGRHPDGRPRGLARPARGPRRWVRRLGYLALATVVAQGVLGGLTVIFLLPTPISVAHACLAQIFFCLDRDDRGRDVAALARGAAGEPRAAFRATRSRGSPRRPRPCLPAARRRARSCATRRRASRSRTSRSRSGGSSRRSTPSRSRSPSRTARARSSSRRSSGAAAVRGLPLRPPGLASGLLALCALVAVQIALGALTVLSRKDVAHHDGARRDGRAAPRDDAALSVSCARPRAPANNVVPIRPTTPRRASRMEVVRVAALPPRPRAPRTSSSSTKPRITLLVLVTAAVGYAVGVGGAFDPGVFLSSWRAPRSSAGGASALNQ